ncbi:hypothetical protein [Streptomyces sp. NPDC050535]|uniref:hypothetical protein n=1 Tax=Streptomyces sp. NPDC050535 TaxID=3365626 RepID=UPI0037A628B1
MIIAAVAASGNGVAVVGRSPGGTSSSVEPRYRVTVWQRVLPVVPSFLATAVFGSQLWTGGMYSGGLIAVSVVWAAALVLGGALPSYFGITLTPAAAVVHNLRRRTIPWSDVQAIGVEPLLGTRTVVIHEVSGRRTRLRAPITGFLAWDRGFEEKVDVIGRWWWEHRGPDWTPAPPPPAWWNPPSDERAPSRGW